MVRVYLSRHNLLTLLDKLDRRKRGHFTFCTIEKNDTTHPKYPCSEPEILVTAIEDEDYYVDRMPGEEPAVKREQGN